MCVHMPACVATARFTLTRERDFAYMLHVVFARVQHALGCMCVHMSACIRRNMLHCVCVCVCVPLCMQIIEECFQNSSAMQSQTAGAGCGTDICGCGSGILPVCGVYLCVCMCA